jgi:Polyketide cyclase / dehydrase and lipid transport
MISFTKKTKVNASGDKVWAIFAHGFNDAHKWMASVPHSFAQANGESFDGAHSDGRVCELSPDKKGIKASEKFLAYNEKNKTATVQIDFVNTPFFFPVKFNTLDFSLRETGANKSEMTWIFQSNIKPLGLILWPLLRVGFGKFVGNIMEELQFYVENETPHPRKIKAMEKN